MVDLMREYDAGPFLKKCSVQLNASEGVNALSQRQYRDAMARFGAAVSVITTDGPAGRCGFTASAVCSVTDEPPTLLVCMNRHSKSNEAFKRNGVLCVNSLCATQQALSPLFAGADKVTMDQRFAAANWTVLSTGAPVLEGALVSFDGRVTQVSEIGTHSVLFCEVDAIHIGDVHEGLIYFDRGYHRIAPA
jgi:flavin reductase